VHAFLCCPDHAATFNAQKNCWNDVEIARLKQLAASGASSFVPRSPEAVPNSVTQQAPENSARPFLPSGHAKSACSRRRFVPDISAQPIDCFGALLLVARPPLNSFADFFADFLSWRSLHGHELPDLVVPSSRLKRQGTRRSCSETRSRAVRSSWRRPLRCGVGRRP